LDYPISSDQLLIYHLAGFNFWKCILWNHYSYPSV
jgi:hypothetical protein